MLKKLINLPRPFKRAILVVNDLFLLSLALWLGFSLRLSEIYYPPNAQVGLVLLGAPLLGVVTFHYMGLYKLVTRFLSYQEIGRIYIATSVAVLVWSVVVFMARVYGDVPRSTFVIYWLLAITFIWSSRQFASILLTKVRGLRVPIREESDQNVLIYGAGSTGIQLASELTAGKNYQPIGFVDDNPSLWRQIVAGYRVHAPGKLDEVIERYRVKEIFLAVPRVNRKRRREILAEIEPYPVFVKTLPAMEDIALGRVSVSDLRPVEADDLLGRDAVPPVADLLKRNIHGKSVLVTGAGGSIGSELTRQVLGLRPARLVLLELSEVALYEIDQQLTQLNKDIEDKERKDGDGAVKKTEIVAVLGSVLDNKLVREIIKTHAINTIYHAAAYKHVPIVELNPVTGIANNTFGTANIARAARELGVERFVLISTDKAVRPTNIMGASKRLAEMVLQAQGDGSQSSTIFTMVRFGNVLDSSGSVVRKFRNQIKDGGPVTVTHKDIIRYFMSITEAAQLVIQAGAMAKGGDVFILDMGDPVKIDDLARSMIRLTGLKLLDSENPDGDIAIEYTGLRPGEKLYEELLIGEDAIKTKHPRIMKSSEKFLPLEKLVAELRLLKQAMNDNDDENIAEILTRTVEGFVWRNAEKTDGKSK